MARQPAIPAMLSLLRRTPWPSRRRVVSSGRDMLHLVCGADAAFAPWLGVMLASLFRFDHGALHIHLLSDAIDTAALQRIADMVASAGAALSIHDVASRLDAEPVLPVFADASRATHCRILAAEFLPPGIDRMLYLDVDLLCRASLRDLWTCDLGGAVAGAVPDCAVGHGAPADLAAKARQTRDLHAVHVGLPADGTYANTGVLLIDLAVWRREEIGPALLAWLRDKRHVQQFADQDAFNSVLRGRLAMLDDCWNRLARWCPRQPDAEAKILHFAGPEKPWHAGYTGPGLAEWSAVHATSPFAAGAPSSVIPRSLKKR